MAHRTRKISEKFQEDLRSGMLYPILANVHRDNNITIEIRNNYINLYYRGGNLLRISEQKTAYFLEFDLKYIKEDNDAKKIISNLPRHVTSHNDAQAWATTMPLIKAEMDNYFVSHKKTEREFQQLVVRENNIGRIAKETDYYICDVEYQIKDTRFDLVAAKNAGKGKYRLALVEMKYADSALGGKSGIIDHIHKTYKYLLSNDINELKKEMFGILEIKRVLRLIDDLPLRFTFTNKKPEFIFLLANHKPASSVLHNELNNLKGENFYNDFCRKADLKFATASFCGYALFSACIYTLGEFEIFNQAVLNIIKKRKK